MEIREKTAQQTVQRNKKEPISNTEQNPLSSEIAKYFLSDAKKAIKVIEEAIINNFSNKGEIKNYIINVHAMKSALANIGEHELSAIASDLEQLARENKIDEILSKTAAFIELLNVIINKLNQAESVTVLEETIEDQVFLQKKLLDIQEACSTLDKKTAKTLLNELKRKKWEHKTNIILYNISEYLLHSEFNKVTALIKDFLFSDE